MHATVYPDRPNNIQVVLLLHFNILTFVLKSLRQQVDTAPDLTCTTDPALALLQPCEIHGDVWAHTDIRNTDTPHTTLKVTRHCRPFQQKTVDPDERNLFDNVLLRGAVLL